MMTKPKTIKAMGTGGAVFEMELTYEVERQLETGELVIVEETKKSTTKSTKSKETEVPTLQNMNLDALKVEAETRGLEVPADIAEDADAVRALIFDFDAAVGEKKED